MFLYHKPNLPKFPYLYFRICCSFPGKIFQMPFWGWRPCSVTEHLPSICHGHRFEPHHHIHIPQNILSAAQGKERARTLIWSDSTDGNKWGSTTNMETQNLLWGQMHSLNSSVASNCLPVLWSLLLITPRMSISSFLASSSAASPSRVLSRH